MPDSDLSKILKSKQLKATKGRIAVLELFLNANSALSHTDIEQRFKDDAIDIDRVTIYRILDCFVENRILHKVSSEKAIQLFALSTDETEQENHQDHAHFICNSCELVECVELLEMIQTQLSQNKQGYAISSYDLTLHGVCKHCNSNENQSEKVVHEVH